MFERKKPSGKLLSLPIDQIHPSPFQARKSFDEQELTALAQDTSWWQGSGGCAPASWQG